MSKKTKKRFAAPSIEYPEYRVVSVTEGRKTWYEVKSHWTKVNGGWMDGRYPTEGMARRVAKRFNAESDKIRNRVEVDLG